MVRLTCLGKSNTSNVDGVSLTTQTLDMRISLRWLGWFGVPLVACDDAVVGVPPLERNDVLLCGSAPVVWFGAVK